MADQPIEPVEAQVTKVAPEPASFGTVFDAAKRKNWIASAAENSNEMMTYGSPVDGYKPSMDEVNVLKRESGLSDEQAAKLSGALSPEELEFRAKRFKEDNDNKKLLEDAGWKGVAAEALSYATDPVMAPTYAIKTPYVVGSLLTKAGITLAKGAVSGVVERAVGAGLVGAATGVGQEAVLSTFDTERDAGDVLIAGLSGFGGGAAFSTLLDGGASIVAKATAKRALGREMLDTVERTDWNDQLGLINSADNTINTGIQNRLVTSGYNRQFKLLEEAIPDVEARKFAMSEGDAIGQFIDELAPDAAARMPRGDRQNLQASAKQAEYSIAQDTARVNEILDTPPSGSGKQLSQARAAQQKELAELRERMAANKETIDRVNGDLEPHTTGKYAQAVSDITRLQQGIIPDRLRARFLDMIEQHDAAPAFDEAAKVLPSGSSTSQAGSVTAMGEGAEDHFKGLIAHLRGEEGAPTFQTGEHYDAISKAFKSGAITDEHSLRAFLSGERVEPETKAPTERDTSIGAAQVKGAIILPDFEGDVLSNSMQANLGYLSKMGRGIPMVRGGGSTSIYTNVMAKIKDNSLRGLAALVFNDPHGVRGAPQSAIAFADAMRQRIMPKAFFIENQAIEQQMASLSINPLTQAGKYNQQVVSFQRDVALRMKELGEDINIKPDDDPITRAAKARAEAYKESLEMMKRYGVRGFQDVDARSSYVPIVFGKNDITSALDKYGEDAVRETLTRGYMNGKIKLSQKSALMVADNTLERFYKKSGSTVQPRPSPSVSGKIADAVEELRASGVPDEEIRTVINMLSDKANDDQVSARAMKSLFPDISQSSQDGLRFVDLMDVSTNGVDKYVRDAAAQSAFAKHGLRSRRETEDTIAKAFELHRKDINELTNRYEENKIKRSKLDESRVPPEDVAALDKEIKDYERMGDMTKYRKLLDSREGQFFDGVKVAYGEPIEADTGLNKVFSASGKLVNWMLLGFSGIAQAADIGHAIARSGLGSVLRNLPTTTYHGVRSLLPSAKYFENNRDLSNIAEIMGSVSHQDFLFGHKMMSGAEYGDAVIGHASKVDKTMDKVSWLQSSMSLMRPIQGFIDELSARSLMTNLTAMARDNTLKGAVKRQFLSMGKITEESLDSSLAHLNTQMAAGKDLFEAMRSLDPMLRDELGTAIRTVHTSNINRAYYGELPAWTNKSFGKMLMRLQTFALISYEKVIQRGIRGDKAGLAASMAWSAGLASIFVDGDVMIQSLKQPPDKREDFIRKRTEDERLYTIANRMSQFALLSTGAQFVNMINPYEDSALQPFGEYRGTASTGALGKIGTGLKSASMLATGESTDEDSDLYKVYGAIPLVNTVTGMAILNTIEGN
ncbi:MAG: hypothetical protein [Caudoviricetes sp.]|nr:MAG: hypothetical protein [Caudoviricetes sp.]